ncbi:tetratricopeptide repeat protein [Planctomicrobium piriforme]|nr:tetratricopeptide repeat protein [Planctomicrobium piriforme]
MRPQHLLCLYLLLSCGCIRTAVVKFWEPADVDVSNMDRIVVLGFSGDQGESVASSLSGQLWENDFYTVVNAEELDSQFQVVSFSEDAEPALNEILGPARAEGIDGVLVGDVIEYKCEDKQVRKTPFKPGQDTVPVEGAREKVIEPRDVTLREGTVTVAFRLVDVESGEVRAQNQVTHNFQALVDSGAQIPSQSEVLEQLTQQCLNDIVQMLTPHEVASQMQLAQCDMWTKGRREVKEGMLKAQSGEWDAAEQNWLAAVEKEAGNHAALFNLAVVADHRQEYDRAEKLAMQALRLQYKDCYAAGLESIRQHRQAADKANAQRDAQIAKIFDDEWH